MNNLRDIKPYLSYNEWFYWAMMTLTSLALLIFIGIVWWNTSRWLHNKKNNLRKQYLKAVKNVDWSNPKKSAYTISHYGRLLTKDKRSIEIFSQLEEMLLEYKYKKDVPPVNNETLNYYHLFIQVLDV